MIKIAIGFLAGGIYTAIMITSAPSGKIAQIGVLIKILISSIF